MPSGGDEEILVILGQDVSDLNSTIDHNLTSPKEKANYQRKVYNDNLPEEFIPLFKKNTAKKSDELIGFFDRFMFKKDRDVNPNVQGTGRKRAVLGVYFYEEDAEEE